MATDSSIKAVVNQIGQGKLPDILQDILKWDVTYDVGVSLCHAYVRRLKQLNGGLLPRTEIQAAVTLLNTLTDGKDEVSEYIFPYFCHIAVIYRQLLIKEKRNILAIGERLLSIENQWLLRSHETQEITFLRNNMYAYSWNYLRDNYSTMETTTSLQYASQALRWLVRKGEKNFSTASHKLHQITYILHRCERHEPVEKLLRDILNESKAIWLKEELPPQSWNRNILQLHGFYNFQICSMRFLMFFGKHDAAQQLCLEIFETFGHLFEPELLELVDKMIKLFFAVCLCFIDPEAQDRDRKSMDGELEDVIKLLKKTETKSPGVRYLIVQGYLQGISSLLQGSKIAVKQSCQAMNTKEFERIVTVLYKLTSVLRGSSPHNDLIHLESRTREGEATSYSLILRLTSDHLNSSTRKETNDFLKKLTEKCFDYLKRIVSKSNPKSRDFVIETYTRMNYHGGQIGSALQGMKDYEGALRILFLAIEVAEKLTEIESIEVTKVDPTHMALVVADTYGKMKQFDTGLKHLSEWLYKHPSIMEKVQSCFDVYEPLLWYDWTYHWNLMKRNAAESKSTKPLVCKTVMDYLIENKEINSSIKKNKKDLLRILRFELNGYFSTKSCLPDGIISVGEALQDHGETFIDKALGLLAEGVGFWWGDGSQVNISLNIFQEALVLLEEELGTGNQTGNPVVSILAAVIHAWLGFALLRRYQELSGLDLETIKNDDAEKNPNRYTGCEDDIGITRVIPAVSSVSLQEEFEIARHLIKAIDTLYELMSFSETQKKQLSEWIDEVGPAVVLLTSQFLSRVILALGDKYNSFKAWCVTNTLSLMYDRKFLFILSSSEMIRLCPSLNDTMSHLIGNVTKTIESRCYNRPGGLHMIRLYLAKSVACLATKKYQEGLNHLVQVLQFRTAKDIFDAGYHALGEAYFILAEFRLLDEPLKLDFSGVPKYVRMLTPAGLVAKGFKALAGVTRSPNPVLSGWVDLLHNYLVLGTVMNVAENAVKHYYLAGKIREVRCFAADFIFLAQQMALVSRTLEIVVPLAEMDIQGRTFDSCQQKVDCILKMISGFIDYPETPTVDSQMLSLIRDKLHISDEEYKWMMEDLNVYWALPPVTLPDHNFGADGPPPVSMTASPMITEPRKMKRIMHLHHKINCACYICLHPSIIPTLLRFISLQARLASCAKEISNGVQALESSNRFHQKAMLRILMNYKAMKSSLSLFVSEKHAEELIDLTYMNYFIKPGINNLTTKLEMMPAMDVSRGIPILEQIYSGLEQLGCDDMVHKSVSLEMLYAAIFRCVFHNSETNVKKSDVRTLIKEAATRNRTALPPVETPPEADISIPACQVVVRRGGRRLRKEDQAKDQQYQATERFAKEKKAVKLLRFGDDEDEGDDDGTAAVRNQDAVGPATRTRSQRSNVAD